MVIVGKFPKILGHIVLSCRHHFHWQVLWTDDEIQHQSYGCRCDGGQERVGDGVEENPTRFFLPSQGRERGDDSQCDGGHSHELEHSCIDRCDEAQQAVQPFDAYPAEDSTDDECTGPNDDILHFLKL